jgi:hypothetical protein
MLLPIFSGGRIMPVFAELPSDLAQGIGVLSEYKSNAEQQAQILVGLAADEDITKDEYRQGQSLYAQAKAGFDGWIDQLIFEVQSGKTELLSPQYESIQVEAKVKGDAFTKYVQKQFLGNPRGEVGDGFKSAFATIKEGALSILKGFSKVSTTDQPEVIKKLEGYKWPEFRIIEQRLQ